MGFPWLTFCFSFLWPDLDLAKFSNNFEEAQKFQIETFQKYRQSVVILKINWLATDQWLKTTNRYRPKFNVFSYEDSLKQWFWNNAG